jgi:hypothetical protein
LFFENLEALYYIEPAVQIPRGTVFTDPIRTRFTGQSRNAHDFTVQLSGGGAYAYTVRQEQRPLAGAGSAAVLQMSALNGGILSTSPMQWGRFLNDINNLEPDFVIIRMDINPLKFNRRQEQELFHQALLTQKNMGRIVFVVSNAENAPQLTMKDGIRYIDLGRRGSTAEIRFRIIEGQIWYDF